MDNRKSNSSKITVLIFLKINTAGVLYFCSVILFYFLKIIFCGLGETCGKLRRQAAIKWIFLDCSLQGVVVRKTNCTSCSKEHENNIHLWAYSRRCIPRRIASGHSEEEFSSRQHKGRFFVTTPLVNVWYFTLNSFQSLSLRKFSLTFSKTIDANVNNLQTKEEKKNDVKIWWRTECIYTTLIFVDG